MYPFFLLSQNIFISPLLGSQYNSNPYIFDFSKTNPEILEMDVDNQEAFNTWTLSIFEKNNTTWGIGKYLENRSTLLRNLPQMVQEQRFFHLGIDIMVPKGTILFAPLDATVETFGYEEDKGNYGGFILLKHSVNNTVFYSLYGHLHPKFQYNVGDTIKQGDAFAEVGDFYENGDWIHHTHMQILTEEGLKKGFISKGYADENTLKIIDTLCPSPLFLFRY